MSITQGSHLQLVRKVIEYSLARDECSCAKWDRQLVTHAVVIAACPPPVVKTCGGCLVHGRHGLLVEGGVRQ